MMNQNKFWSLVDKSGECWIWTGTIRAGYGIVAIVKDGKKTTAGTHRLSYEWRHGPVPTGLFVLHSCDTPLCVNPDHLFVGTHKQNMDDMRSKHRQPGFLTEDFVISARLAAARGDNIAMLPAPPGATRMSIIDAVTGKSWKHINTPTVSNVVFKAPRKVNKLSHEQINEILKSLEKPYWGQVNDLAKKYGVRHSTISHIKTGRFVPADFNL